MFLGCVLPRLVLAAVNSELRGENGMAGEVMSSFCNTLRILVDLSVVPSCEFINQPKSAEKSTQCRVADASTESPEPVYLKVGEKNRGITAQHES